MTNLLPGLLEFLLLRLQRVDAGARILTRGSERLSKVKEAVRKQRWMTSQFFLPCCEATCLRLLAQLHELLTEPVFFGLDAART